MARLVSFWALNSDGTYDVPLPDVASWTLSPVDGSPGAVTLDYPAVGRNFDTLRDSVTQDRDLEIAIWITGGDEGSLRALLNTSEGDDVAEGAMWRFSGNFLAVRMEEAVVAPRTVVVTPPTGPVPTEDLAAFRVYAATAGQIMATLMAEAISRSALHDITYSFTNTLDSQGAPWTKTITSKIAPGTTYLAVLQALAEALMCEWDVIWNGTDRELVLWEHGTRGTDHTVADPPLILWAGDTITESPRKHTVRDAGTTLIVAGGEGLYDDVEDATAVARRGRRIERYISQGSLTTAGGLTAYAAAKLPLVTTGAMEVAHGLAMTTGGPWPLIDYQVGDWLWSDTGHGLERFRVRQPTLAGDEHGITTAGVSLNDLIANQLETLSKRIAGIEGGTTITGTSNASLNPAAVDTMPPAVPLGVVVDSLAQPSAETVPRSAVVAEWSEVITNADTTTISDLAGYVVQWRYTSPSLTNNWIQLAPVDTEIADWDGVIAGEAIEVRVAAVDTTGNQGAWSASAFHTTETDATPPPVPSTPVASEFLGTLTVEWDGLGSVGEPMPADTAGARIHRSTVSGFTPSAGTFLETMVGAGPRNYTGLPYGVEQFFRLVAFDRTGNESGPSAQASATPAEIGMGDIAFTNPGNLVEDGSFELAGSRATHAARSHAAWMFIGTGGQHGDWFARGTATTGSGDRTLVLSPRIPVSPGQQFAYRLAIRGTGANGDLSIRVRWYKSDATTSDTSATWTPTDATGAWLAKESSPYTAPALTEEFEVRVQLNSNCTAGTWDVDRVEVRERIGTLLVQDAAITNAKIVDLSVGKLTAGTITAVMLMAGLLRSGTTGLRYELDDDGLRFYDASNNIVINLDVATASAVLTGTVQTGRTGRRVVMSGSANELRFLPQSGETRYARLFSYIPGNLPDDIAIEMRAIDSDDVSYTARHWLLPDSTALAVAPQGSGGDLVSKSLVSVHPTEIDISLNNIVGTAPFETSDYTRRGRIHMRDSGIFLDVFNGTTRDGGYLILNRGTVGDVYLGKKTSTVDSGLFCTGTGGGAAEAVKIYTIGLIRAEVTSNGMFCNNFSGLSTPGYRANITADAGGPIFFYWSGGTLNIGTGVSFVKTFVIDHPAKTDRYLVHSTTESPHAGVEYWGTATVEDGEVEVELPDYFEALTRPDGRNVQVTVLAENDPDDRKKLKRRKPRKEWTPHVTPGAPASQLPPVPPGLPPTVQATVPRNGKFTIYSVGAVDTFRVMWLVKAIRRDVPPVEVEPLKTGGEVRGDGPYTYYVPRYSPATDAP